MNTLRNYLVFNSAGVFGLSILSRGLGFVTNIVLARLLGVQQYGIYVFVMSWFGLLAILSMFGMRQVLIREIARYAETQQWGAVRGILTWSLGQTLMFSGGCALFAGGLVWLVRGGLAADILPGAWVALVGLPLSVLAGVAASGMQGLRHVTLAKLPALFIQVPLFLLLLFGVGIVGTQEIDAMGAIALLTLASAVALLFALGLLYRLLPVPVKHLPAQYERPRWRTSGFTMLLAEGISELNVRLPVILIGLLAAVEVSGLFNVAQLLTGIAGLVLVSVNSALSPVIASLYAGDDKQRLQRVITRATRLMLALTLGISAGIWLLQDTLLQFFGEGFAGIGPILGLLIIAQLLNTAAGSVGQLLLMTGYEQDVTRTMLYSTLLLFGLLVVLIPPFSAGGAALAVVVSTVYWNGRLVLIAAKRLGIDSTIFGYQLVATQPPGSE